MTYNLPMTRAARPAAKGQEHRKVDPAARQEAMREPVQAAAARSLPLAVQG